MPGPEPFINLVEKRADFVECLRTGTKDKSAIIADLGVSRSTAHRALDELVEQGLVDEVLEGYRSTLFGRLALQMYRRFEKNVEELADHRDVFSGFGDSSELDTALLLDGRIVSRKEAGEPGTALFEATRRCDHFTAVAGIHRPELLDPLHRRISEGNLEAEIVMTEEVLRYLESYHADKVRDVFESGNLELHILGREFPWGMVMTEKGSDRQVFVALHDELNQIQALTINENAAAVHSFLRTYRELRKESVPVHRETHATH
ncbi:MAG: hypothetical protein MAG715_00883 [Methanonatronarchaeales archaeon]|nr:hypothetical protein [Methanonatronarchaeales archaeon]